RSASCRWVRFRVRRISAMKRPVLLWFMGISLLSDGIIASGRPEEHPRTVEWRPRGAKTPPAKRGGAAGGKSLRLLPTGRRRDRLFLFTKRIFVWNLYKKNKMLRYRERLGVSILMH